MVPSNPQHCIQGQRVGAYRAGTRERSVSALLETHIPAESVAQRTETLAGLWCCEPEFQKISPFTLKWPIVLPQLSLCQEREAWVLKVPWQPVQAFGHWRVMWAVREEECPGKPGEYGYG